MRTWWVFGTCVLGTFLAASLTGACADDEGAAGSTQSTSSSVGLQGGGNPQGGGTATSVGGGSVPPPPTEIAECQGHLYACGDLQDNDMDGLIDYQDPDCLGPCDNTEDSYYGGIPGQNNAPCKADCYFDQDSGAGNDDCYWSHQCDDHETAPEYYPEPWNGATCAHDENAAIPGTTQGCAELSMTQSQTCLDYCGPLTPNGCDCFGCCELPAGTGNYVYLGSSDTSSQKCDIAHVNDPTVCHPCEVVPACLNGCDTCELCIGKTVLPPECDDPMGQQCGEGVQQCGLAGQDPCPAGYYCISGCCQALPQ